MSNGRPNHHIIKGIAANAAQRFTPDMATVLALFGWSALDAIFQTSSHLFWRMRFSISTFSSRPAPPIRYASILPRAASAFMRRSLLLNHGVKPASHFLCIVLLRSTI